MGRDSGNKIQEGILGMVHFFCRRYLRQTKRGGILGIDRFPCRRYFRQEKGRIQHPAFPTAITKPCMQATTTNNNKTFVTNTYQAIKAWISIFYDILQSFSFHLVNKGKLEGNDKNICSPVRRYAWTDTLRRLLHRQNLLNINTHVTNTHHAISAWISIIFGIIQSFSYHLVNKG